MRVRALAGVAMAIAVVAVGPAQALGGARVASTSKPAVKCRQKTRAARRRCQARRRKALKKAAQTPPNSIVIQDYAFRPSVLRIAQGATVTWLFRDNGIAHWVVSDSEAFTFQSSPQTTGSLTVNYPQAGSFAYSCTLHTWMKGEVIVTAPSS